MEMQRNLTWKAHMTACSHIYDYIYIYIFYSPSSHIHDCIYMTASTVIYMTAKTRHGVKGAGDVLSKGMCLRWEVCMAFTV